MPILSGPQASSLRREIFLRQAIWSAAANPASPCEAGTTPSGPQQRSLLRRCEARPSPQQTKLHHCVVCLCRNELSFTTMKRLVFQASLNTHDGHLFPPNNFWCAPSSPISSYVHFFFRFQAVNDYYGAQEDRPSQSTSLWLHIPSDTSPSGRSASFHFSGGRVDLPRVAL